LTRIKGGYEGSRTVPCGFSAREWAAAMEGAYDMAGKDNDKNNND